MNTEAGDIEGLGEQRRGPLGLARARVEGGTPFRYSFWRKSTEHKPLKFQLNINQSNLGTIAVDSIGIISALRSLDKHLWSVCLQKSTDVEKHKK